MGSADTTTKPYGSSLYEHGKGQYDEICQDAKPGSTEPCNLLAAPDGWRYVIFPESKYCCRACNVTQVAFLAVSSHVCAWLTRCWMPACVLRDRDAALSARTGCSTTRHTSDRWR